MSRWFLLVLLTGCPEKSVVRDAGQEGRCERDADCPPGSLCACNSAECSIAPTFSFVSGSPDHQCIGRDFRLDARLPIRVDGGWTIEADPQRRVFATRGEAGSAALELPR
jgi:hypothetical protein